MTIEQYNQAQKIIEELRESKNLLAALLDGKEIQISVKKQSGSVFDKYLQDCISYKLDTSVYQDIIVSVKNRIHFLEKTLERI